MTNQDLFLIFGALIIVYLVIQLIIEKFKENKEKDKKAQH